MTQQPNILISILGTGIYQEVIYRSEDGKQAAKGKYVAKALHEIFSPDRTFIIMTEGAKKVHFEELSQAFSFDPVYIPDGKNEKEIWEMFSIIANAIPPHCRLCIDVTHGFRSQPMLMLAIAIYLESVKQVQISQILYGAWEAKESATGIAPVISLKSFLDLIKWAYATRTFNETGNARQIAELTKSIQAEAWVSNAQFKPQQLSTFGNVLQKMSASMATVRPHEVTEHADWLINNIASCINDIDNTHKAAPFKNLLSLIQERFESMKGVSADLLTESGLRIQKNLISYYIQIHQYQQAVTLARELAVSVICLRNGWHPVKERGKAEEFLNLLTYLLKKKEIFKIMMDDEQRKLAQLWDKIVQLRNDINHAAMNDKPMPASQMMKGIIEVCAEVAGLNVIQQAPVH